MLERGLSQRFQFSLGVGVGHQPCGLKHSGKGVNLPPLFLKFLPAVLWKQPQRFAVFAKPQVGVVLTQVQAVFGAGGEHAVRLRHALGDEVVHQNAKVGFIAAQDERLALLHLERSVDSGNQALCGGFLVSGGAVDLSGKKKPGHRFQLQRVAQLGGIHIIVLDRVARLEDFHLLQPFDGAQKFQLHLGGQTGGQPVWVDHEIVIRQSGRLQKDLMPLLVGELDDLVLNGRAVARADSGDAPAVKRGAVQVVLNHAMGARVRVGDMAADLRLADFGVPKRKTLRRLVSGLHLQHVPVDGALVHTGGGPGLHAAQRQVLSGEREREFLRRRLPHAPRLLAFLAPVDEAVEEGSGGDDHRLAEEFVGLGADACNALIPEQQFLHHALGDVEVRLSLQHPAHFCLVLVHLGLAARAASRRAARGVEHAELDSSGVRDLAHFAAERVNLLDEVPLADSADGRIARHLRDGVAGHRDQQGAAAHAGRSQRGFTSGVASANHQHVVGGGMRDHGSSASGGNG